MSGHIKNEREGRIAFSFTLIPGADNSPQIITAINPIRTNQNIEDLLPGVE
jgi:hypothetical protein